MFRPRLEALEDRTVPSELSFVLLGNPTNPSGGLLARYPGFPMPSLDLRFYGATPSPQATEPYTVQYDGWADFPHYPLNLLADLNALSGLSLVHGNYPAIAAAPTTGVVPAGADEVSAAVASFAAVLAFHEVIAGGTGIY